MSPHSSLIKCLILSLSFFFFFEISPFLSLLGQTSARSAPEAASSLESEGFEGACCSPFTVLPPPSPFCAFPSPFLPMAKPLVSFPSFSHFAKVSSTFLQRAACSLTESTKKQEEEAPPQEADTGPFFFSLFFFFFCFSYFTFSWLFPLFFEPCLLLQVLTRVLDILSSWFLKWL